MTIFNNKHYLYETKSRKSHAVADPFSLSTDGPSRSGRAYFPGLKATATPPGRLKAFGVAPYQPNNSLQGGTALRWADSRQLTR